MSNLHGTRDCHAAAFNVWTAEPKTTIGRDLIHVLEWIVNPRWSISNPHVTLIRTKKNDEREKNHYIPILLSRAAICQSIITATIPLSTPLRSVSIPLRPLAFPSDPGDGHSAALLDPTNEKQGRRHSSDSAGSDFSLWSDTGDLAEQLADEQDPLRINLPSSFDNPVPRRSLSPQGRQSKHVHYAPQGYRERKNPHPGVNKEAIQIPNPPLRVISRAEKFLATIMTGDQQASHSYGLTGKPLLYARI